MNSGISPLNRYQMVSTILVIIAGLYLGICALTNKNLVTIVLDKIVPSHTVLLLKILYIVFGLAAVYLIFSPSHTFLPFLDKTVMPPSIMLLSEQGDTNVELKIDAPEEAVKVVYWAARADTGKVINNPYDAYDKFENYGIAAVKDGKAILKLNCPNSYKVPKVGNLTKKQLPKHVHIRFVYENGVLSEVITRKLDC
jgi:uncharacterized membrane protein YuzA (DUF378 family)